MLINAEQRHKESYASHFFACSHLVIKVAQAAVALGGSVELSNLTDVEAVHELLPYRLAQAVAQRHAHAMLTLRVP